MKNPIFRGRVVPEKLIYRNGLNRGGGGGGGGLGKKRGGDFLRVRGGGGQEGVIP